MHVHKQVLMAGAHAHLGAHAHVCALSQRQDVPFHELQIHAFQSTVVLLLYGTKCTVQAHAVASLLPHPVLCSCKLRTFSLSLGALPLAGSEVTLSKLSPLCVCWVWRVTLAVAAAAATMSLCLLLQLQPLCSLACLVWPQVDTGVVLVSCIATVSLPSTARRCLPLSLLGVLVSKGALLASPCQSRRSLDRSVAPSLWGRTALRPSRSNQAFSLDLKQAS